MGALPRSEIKHTSPTRKKKKDIEGVWERERG